VLLFCFFCSVRYRSLQRDGQAFIRVLQDVFVCLIVCDRETSKLRRPRTDLVCCATEKRVFLISIKFSVRNDQSYFLQPTGDLKFKGTHFPTL
jgi:hypothetical protein